MREQMRKKLMNLNSGKIPVDEAQEQLLLLFDASKHLFICDICGEEKSGEKFPVFDENWNKQNGLTQCEKCFFKSNDNYDNIELDELYETKRNLEHEIENFFGNGQKHSGDRNYQILLERLEEVEEEIKKMLNIEE